MSFEGVLEVIVFTLRILDQDVMSFRHDPLVGIRMCYSAIKSKTLNRYTVLKWLMVVQHPILECNYYTIYEYILIISDHMYFNIMSADFFNLSAD